jgi:hypothetical protein
MAQPQPTPRPSSASPRAHTPAPGSRLAALLDTLDHYRDPEDEDRFDGDPIDVEAVDVDAIPVEPPAPVQERGQTVAWESLGRERGHHKSAASPASPVEPLVNLGEARYEATSPLFSQAQEIAALRSQLHSPSRRKNRLPRQSPTARTAKPQDRSATAVGPAAPQGDRPEGFSFGRFQQGFIAATAGLVFLLTLLAPEFMTQSLRGHFSLSLLQWELQSRVDQIKGLMLGEAEPTDLHALRNAIIGQESGGDHKLLNASGSGATGLGQVMPENIAAWSKETIGREVSFDEFLHNPNLQITIIDRKLRQYWVESLWDAKGDRDEAVMRVASWWYSGNPDYFRSTTPQYWNGDPYPSIAEYSQSVLQRYKIKKVKVVPQ